MTTPTNPAAILASRKQGKGNARAARKAAQALAAMRKTHAGGKGPGRPRDPVRCACGIMTAARAEKRRHKCELVLDRKPALRYS